VTHIPPQLSRGSFSGHSIDAHHLVESGFQSERPRPEQENRLFGSLGGTARLSFATATRMNFRRLAGIF
jgi:hypothetical protein